MCPFGRPVGTRGVFDVVSVTVRVDRDGDRGRLVPTGPFDLAHAAAVARAVEHPPPELEGCRSIDVDLGHLDRIDGAGAVLLAGFLDRLDAGGTRTQVVDDRNAEAARLIALYRTRREERQAPPAPRRDALTRIGVAGSALPVAITGALDFAGRCAVAIPKAVATPRSVDWHSLPRLLQEIGADGLVVTGAANFLVGLIIGLLGISQLARFGAVVYVPELVVVAQFRELGPLVTAIVVAGRSGAGLASELATMKVSEEIDALRSMGFDPVRWLVVPRCVALVVVLPLLTWIGNALALLGGFLATVATTEMPERAYCPGDHRRDHRRSPAGRPGQDAVSRAGDRPDFLPAGTGRARRRGSGWREDDECRRDGDPRGDRDQRPVHVLLHARWASDHAAIEGAHHRRGSANRVGEASAHGARELPGRARHDHGHPRRVGKRQEHAAALFDRPRAASGRPDRYRRGRRAASLRRRAALRRAVSVRRALQLADARAEPRATADGLDADSRRDRAATLSGQARARRTRSVRRASAGRDLGRHEEACRHRTRADAGAGSPVLRRAVCRARPDFGGRARPAHRDAEPRSRASPSSS